MSFLLRYRYLFFSLMLLGVGFLSRGILPALKPDNSLRIWFLQDDPQLKAYEQFHTLFGNDEVILLQIDSASDIVESDSIARLRLLHERLLKIEGVARVNSFLNMPDVVSDSEGIRLETVIPDELPQEDAALEALETRILQNPFVKDRLLSSDGRHAMLWIQMAAMANFDAMRDDVVAQVRSVASEVLDEDFRYAMGGTGVIYSALNTMTEQDFVVFVVAGDLLILLVMCWFFRSVLLVVGTMGVIALATCAGLGLYGLMGHQLNLVTVMLPTLIMVLGIVDVIHIPTTFMRLYKQEPTLSRFELVRRCMAECFWPCMMTTFTTMCGFLALTTSPMAVIRMLGYYTAWGMLFATVVSFSLMPVLLFFVKKEMPVRQTAPIKRLLDFCQHAVLRRYTETAIITVFLCIIACLGMMRVQVDTDSLSYFPQDHQVLQDHRQIERHFGPYGLMDYTVTALNGHHVNDPQLLSRTANFIKRVVALDAVYYGVGLPDLYARFAEVMGVMAFRGGRFGANEIAQLQLLLDSVPLEWNPQKQNFASNAFAPFMNENASTGRLFFVGKIASAKKLQNTINEVSQIAKASFGSMARVEPAGYPPLYVKIVDYIVSSQVQGFFWAIVMIFGIMFAWLRNFKLALLSLIPNVFPVLVMMGIMGYCGINLDIATATVGAIVVGVSIDNTIHLLHHWKSQYLKGASFEEAIKHAFTSAGIPAVATTIVLLAGYPVLMLAQSKTIVYFGLLTTISAVSALFGDLIMMPLLLKRFFYQAEQGCKQSGQNEALFLEKNKSFN